MNVEKTIEFILQQQARTEQWQAKTEGQLAAIRKLVQTGMKMLVQQGEQIKQLTAAQKELAGAQKETAAELAALARSQRVTETKLQSLIDSLRRGRNGGHSRN